MKIARFWTRQPGEATARDGSRVRTTARGWSNDSIEDAARVASETAARVAQRIASGGSKFNQYMYGDRPLPEPVLQAFGESGIVTRNVYGAEVLNTHDLMFVDIDRGGRGVTRDIEKVVSRYRLSARAYKTAAGHRVIVTNTPFSATDGQAEALLRDFGSDPLYIRLCKTQESFRARLTPKPWRCGLPVPPVTFPYETPQDESRFKVWQSQYDAMAQDFATCQFVGCFGPIETLPVFEGLIQFHDAQSGATSDLPLA
jgi:hypothetical protein